LGAVTNLKCVKRLATLAASLCLMAPVLHWETSLVAHLNTALGSPDAVSAQHTLDGDVSHAFEPMRHVFNR